MPPLPPAPPPTGVVVRPLAAADHDGVRLVALRMRDTLVEVLGAERGAAMYTLAWLEERVRWHLGADCVGQVFVAEAPGAGIVAHTIVRIEPGGEAGPLGLVSTTYVLPTWRRAGVADALLDAGEHWLVARGATTLATNTSDTNAPLVRLYEKHGYQITFRDPESRMIQLTRAVGG